jgi:hypothetical protein
MGNHTGISVFQAQLLENAEMNLLQRKLYKIKGSTVWDYMEGNQDPNDPYKEGVEVIIATKDMPLEDMLDCQIFSWFIITCHVNGLTNWISRILDKHDLKTYEEFYTGFFEHCKNDPWFSEQIENIRTRYLSWMLDGKIDHPRIAGIQIHGWNLIHSTTIKIHVDQKYDHIFNLIKDYTTSLNVGLNNLDQLLEFQRLNIVEYTELDQYPKVKQFNVDPVGYLLYDKPYNEPSTYSFGFKENKDMSLQMFCENIFFGRRRNFGKAWIDQI